MLSWVSGGVEINVEDLLACHIVTWQKTYLFNICRRNEKNCKQNFSQVRWIFSDGKKNILVWPSDKSVNATGFSKKVKFQRFLLYISKFEVSFSNSNLDRKSNMYQKHNCVSVAWNRVFWRKYQRDLRFCLFHGVPSLKHFPLWFFCAPFFLVYSLPYGWGDKGNLLLNPDSDSAPFCQLLHIDGYLLSQI